MKAHFLNVDLEIRSKSPLKSLAKAFGKQVAILYCGTEGRGRYLLAIESGSHSKSAVVAANALCKIVENLPPSARKVWDSAQARFDFGYELRPGERMLNFSLPPNLIARIAKLGAHLAVTCYRHDESVSS